MTSWIGKAGCRVMTSSCWPAELQLTRRRHGRTQGFGLYTTFRWLKVHWGAGELWGVATVYHPVAGAPFGGVAYRCAAGRAPLIAEEAQGRIGYEMLEQAVRDLPGVPVSELWDRFIAWTEPAHAQTGLEVADR